MLFKSKTTDYIMPDDPALTQQLMRALAQLETHFGAKAVIDDGLWSVKLHARLAPNLHMMHPNETVGWIYVFPTTRAATMRFTPLTSTSLAAGQNVASIVVQKPQPYIAGWLGVRADLYRALAPGFKTRLALDGNDPEMITALADEFLAIAAPRAKRHHAANRRR